MSKSSITQVQYQNLKRRPTYIAFGPINTILGLMVLGFGVYFMAHLFAIYVLLPLMLLFLLPLLIEGLYKLKISWEEKKNQLRSLKAPAWTLLEENLKDNLDLIKSLNPSTQHRALILAAHGYEGSIEKLIEEVSAIKTDRQSSIEHFAVRHPQQANMIAKTLICFTDAQYEILLALDNSQIPTFKELVELTRSLEG